MIFSEKKVDLVSTDGGSSSQIACSPAAELHAVGTEHTLTRLYWAIIIQYSLLGLLQQSLFSALHKAKIETARDQEKNKEQSGHHEKPTSEQNHSTLYETSCDWQRFTRPQLYRLIRVSQFSCLKYKETAMEVM